MPEPVLVTGAAGFIGYHLASVLLQDGIEVIGFDNVNDYYDPALKRARLARLGGHKQFTFVEGGLQDRGAVDGLFQRFPIRRVVHLAAQAGVRYSAINPYAYGDSNLTGFLNMLEACRRSGIEHLMFA